MTRIRQSSPARDPSDLTTANFDTAEWGRRRATPAQAVWRGRTEPMERRAAIATYRAGFGLLAIAAIATQLIDLSGKGTLNLVSYFSYFTIQSNLIAATVLIVGAARWRKPHSSTFDLVRGGAVVYMSITGIVFTLLLSGTDVDTAIPWVNTVVHQLMPIVLVVDWLLDPPAGNLTYRQGLLWLIYPLVWIIYILIRGALVGLYPYPFLDPDNGGYGSVAVYCVAILFLMALVSAATVWLAHAVQGRAAA